MVIGSPTVLNLIPGGVMKMVHVNQTDKNMDIQFQIMNGNQPFNVPEGWTGTIRGTKGDAFGYAASVTVTAGSNLVTAHLKEQLTAVAGVGNVFELVFASTSAKVSTENFILAVEKAALNDETVISESDLVYANQVLNQLQSVAAVNQQVQQNKANIATETATRAAADTTLQNNINTEEAARQAADQTLQSNINAEASTRATADASLQSQIDQLVAPSGEAPSAAEVLNARIGADGVTYPTLGDAIRTNDSELKSQIGDNLQNGPFVQGNDNGSKAVSASTTRIVFISDTLPDGGIFSVAPNGKKIYCNVYDGTTRIWSAGWITENITFSVFKGGAFSVVVANTNDSAILPVDNTARVTHIANALNSVDANTSTIDNSTYEYKQLRIDTRDFWNKNPQTDMSMNVSPDRVCLKNFLHVYAGDVIKVTSDDQALRHIINAWKIESGTVSQIFNGQWTTKSIDFYRVAEESYITIVLSRSSGHISAFEANAIKIYKKTEFSKEYDLSNIKDTFFNLNARGTYVNNRLTSQFISWDDYRAIMIDFPSGYEYSITGYRSMSYSEIIREPEWRSGKSVLQLLTPYSVIIVRKSDDSNLSQTDITDAFKITLLYKLCDNVENRYVKSICHRGYNISNVFPENTLIAFTAAANRGFKYVESDVRFTSDGYAVMIHDATVDRTTNGTGNVADKTLAQIRSLDAGSWVSPIYSGCKVPTFEEFLVCCKENDLFPIIEIKTGTTEQICDLYRKAIKYGFKGNMAWYGSATYINDLNTIDETLYYGVASNGSIADTDAISAYVTDSNHIFASVYMTNVATLTEAEEEYMVNKNIELFAWQYDKEEEIQSLLINHATLRGIFSNGVNADLVFKAMTV